MSDASSYTDVSNHCATAPLAKPPIFIFVETTRLVAPNDCGREGALPKENCAALCNQPLIGCELACCGAELFGCKANSVVTANQWRGTQYD